MDGARDTRPPVHVRGSARVLVNCCTYGFEYFRASGPSAVAPGKLPHAGVGTRVCINKRGIRKTSYTCFLILVRTRVFHIDRVEFNSLEFFTHVLPQELKPSKPILLYSSNTNLVVRNFVQPCTSRRCEVRSGPCFIRLHLHQSLTTRVTHAKKFNYDT